MSVYLYVTFWFLLLTFLLNNLPEDSNYLVGVWVDGVGGISTNNKHCLLTCLTLRLRSDSQKLGVQEMVVLCFFCLLDKIPSLSIMNGFGKLPGRMRKMCPRFIRVFIRNTVIQKHCEK